MKNKINILIWLLTIPILTNGQDFIKKDAIQVVADTLVKLTNNEKIVSAILIDFTGNQEQDFIITTEIDENNYRLCEYWITSNFKKVRQAGTYREGIQLREFINLDDDIELEIIDASGFEDGIDYTIKDLDIETGNLKTLLYFNPIIETEEKVYWGYPWDWTRLKFNSDKRIKASLKHSIERDGNITFPDNQQILPIIYFEGVPTQESVIEKIEVESWLTLNEIIEKSR